MQRNTRVLLGFAATALVAYVTGQWALVIGYGAGYLAWRWLPAALAAGFGNVLIGVFVVTSVACSGLFAVLTCVPGLVGSLLVGVPLLIIGGIEGVIGWYLGRRLSK